MDSENMNKLVKDAKKGNAEAFACLYSAVYKDLYKTAYYTLGNISDAEDVVSDTITDAYASIRLLKNSKAFRGWIYKILINKCKQTLKSYINITLPLEEDQSTYERDYEEIMDLKNAFSSLDATDRLILSLSTFGGYNSKEIAEIIGMNANTIRSNKSRALEIIKHQLKY